jgi:hypothetical protein
MPSSDPLALLIGAAVVYFEGDVVAARRLLTDAIGGFDRAGMTLHGAVARRRFSELVTTTVVEHTGVKPTPG